MCGICRAKTPRGRFFQKTKYAIILAVVGESGDAWDLEMARRHREEVLQEEEDRWCKPKLPLSVGSSFLTDEEVRKRNKYNERQEQETARRREIVAKRRAKRGYVPAD